MFCPSCGAENPDNKNFCRKCRRPLNVIMRISQDLGRRLGGFLRRN